MKKFEKQKVAGQQLRSRLKWKAVGDQCSREFFQLHRAKSNASHITELKDVQGQAHTSQTAMAEICSDYYKKLYTAREELGAAVGAQEAALRYIKDKLSPNLKTNLQVPLSQEELHLVL